jgi:hypothetical protein
VLWQVRLIEDKEATVVLGSLGGEDGSGADNKSGKQVAGS